MLEIDIDGKDLRVIRNLFWDQTASVRIKGEHSDFKPIKRGVRQGSTLSLLGARSCLRPPWMLLSAPISSLPLPFGCPHLCQDFLSPLDALARACQLLDAPLRDIPICARILSPLDTLVHLWILHIECTGY
ncbi:endonuclease-reverse transcriptase [Plakobranchus ocellatus]|uniref:Endonuclease-reverse transcriptase n=1 Tax=Plakobranchus ocellatus TaxID=259542 RepID=A0AAV3YFK1_9GAST|nr:endonuclease-reverse transcriptase [Plakobranchus ocellatus]